MDKKEISILGGGPSGMSAAITLRKNGYRPVVYEVRERPGARFVNGWQILENYTDKRDAIEDLKQMGIADRFRYIPGRSMRFYDWRLRQYDFRCRDPFGYFIVRGPGEETLDTALHRQAQEAGVEIRYGQRGTPEDCDIITSGRMKAAGISKEIVFDSDSDDILITLLDNHIAPLGFSYLFILGGRGTIGTAILKDFKYIDHYSEQAFLRFQQISRFSIFNRHESASSVGFFLPHTAEENGKLFAGESAGFQDFLFGLGIRRAIQSGHLAARSIIDNVSYDRLWKDTFEKSMKSGILNRLAYEKAGNRGLSGAMRLAQRFDFRSIGHFLHNPSTIRLGIACIARRMSRNPNPLNTRSAWNRQD